MFRRSPSSPARCGARPAACALATAAALLLPVASAGAVERTEQVIQSRSPQTDVQASVVSLKVPLPAGAPAHPAAYD
ncbi:MAG: hypothetical protein QM679_01780 [Patulibacter sp.]